MFHTKELGIEVVPFRLMVYLRDSNSYKPIDEVAADETALNISGTEFRRMLAAGEEVPEWFSYQGVIEELKKPTLPEVNKDLLCF